MFTCNSAFLINSLQFNIPKNTDPIMSICSMKGGGVVGSKKKKVDLKEM